MQDAAANTGAANASTLLATGLALHAVIGAIAFLTVVDLFATQAILPSLVAAYHVSPAAMGTAVNASTFGMAIAGLAVAYCSRQIDRRNGIVASLVLLSIPTALLATAPDLATFTLLRIAQGLCMSAAFTLTLAYLAEETCGTATAAAFAAYITGNVASNLFGRLMSASIAGSLGLAANFYIFSALNLVGAALVFATLTRMSSMAVPLGERTSQLAVWRKHLSYPPLQASFAIGFCILFAFIGTFTYVNFILIGPPISLGMMSIGLAYFVFLPAIFTTPMAGRLVGHAGTRSAMRIALGIAIAGTPLLLLPSLPAVLTGMTLIGIGTFLAQAIATGFVGRVARAEPGSASGMYLACYFLGGLTGSAVLGQLFVTFGWPACVVGVALGLALAAYLAGWMRE